MTEPRPVSELDKDLKHVVRRSTYTLRVITYALAVTVALLLGTVIYLLVQNANSNQTIADSVDQAVSSDCGFFYGVGTLPLVGPGPKQSSKLAVQLVISGRDTFIGQHCEGSLGPAQPALMHLATEYGITLRG
jgi:hypothetical protein